MFRIRLLMSANDPKQTWDESRRGGIDDLLRVRAAEFLSSYLGRVSLWPRGDRRPLHLGSHGLVESSGQRDKDRE
jgi:hypothetical protein